MAKPADRSVSLAELRFKPANSNDAARAVLAHHFDHVPRCSYAKDDGISQYLGSETGMGTFPAALDAALPDDKQEPAETPAIQSERPDGSASLRRKLLRGGFALSIFLHVIAAFALGYTTLKMPDETQQEEGTISVTFVTDGDGNINARLEGEKEEIKEPDPEIEKPVEKPVEKVVEPKPEPVRQPQPVKQVEVAKPVQEPVENILKDVPMPVLGANNPDILTAAGESKTETEATAVPQPVEEKREPVLQKQPAVVVPEKPVETIEVKPVPAAKPLAHPVARLPEVVKLPEPKPVEKPVLEAETKPVVATKSLAHPVTKPVEVAKVPVEEPHKEPVQPTVIKKQEPAEKKKVEKKKQEKPVKKRRQNKGDQGDQTARSKRGDVNPDNQGQSSPNSRGDTSGRDIGNSDRTNYKGLVNKKLARAKGRISSPAKGKVTVNFTIQANGAISGLRVKESSGKPALDSAAMSIVRNASPFPAIPAETGKKSWAMTVPMTFK